MDPRDDPRTIRHWRFFNVSCRVLGIGFVLWGAAFAAWGYYLLANPAVPFWVEGVESHDTEPRLVMALFATLMFVTGAFMLLVRAYRPDLGDTSYFDRIVDPFGSRDPTPYRGRRSWWTGDRQSGSSHSAV